MDAPSIRKTAGSANLPLPAAVRRTRLGRRLDRYQGADILRDEEQHDNGVDKAQFVTGESAECERSDHEAP